MKIAAAILGVALLLGGCAAGGVKVSEAQLSHFQPGVTTKLQVIGALGPPTIQMRLADGTSMVVYSYYEARVRPQTFIPVVGAVVGGSDSTSTTATLRFDAADKLLDTSTSSSSFGTGMGPSAGQITPTTVDQPK